MLAVQQLAAHNGFYTHQKAYLLLVFVTAAADLVPTNLQLDRAPDQSLYNPAVSADCHNAEKHACFGVACCVG